MKFIKQLVEAYRTKKGLKIVTDGMEEQIRLSFPSSKLINSGLWGWFRKRFIALAKADDIEMTAIVCGFEGYIAGFLLGEGYSAEDVMKELGCEKWKEYIDDSIGVIR